MSKTNLKFRHIQLYIFRLLLMMKMLVLYLTMNLVKSTRMTLFNMHWNINCWMLLRPMQDGRKRKRRIVLTDYRDTRDNQVLCRWKGVTIRGEGGCSAASGQETAHTQSLQLGRCRRPVRTRWRLPSGSLIRMEMEWSTGRSFNRWVQAAGSGERGEITTLGMHHLQNRFE